MKNKTATCPVGASKSMRKSIKSGTKPLALRPNQNENLKINDQIRKSLYNWIMHHPQVVQSPVFNDCLKVNINGHIEPQLVPKCLL